MRETCWGFYLKFLHHLDIVAYHAGHIQQIFSKYRRLAFSANLRWKIETFAFYTELATFCMSADNTNPHEWEEFC
jgi:hypothetical protein